MTNSQLFKSAHKLAKTFTGSYLAKFTLALEQIRAGLFQIKSYSGRDFIILCEIGNLLMNGWGKCFNTNISLIVDGITYKAEAYFNFYAIKIDGEMKNFASLTEIMNIEREFETKMSINQGFLGSHVK